MTNKVKYIFKNFCAVVNVIFLTIYRVS